MLTVSFCFCPPPQVIKEIPRTLSEPLNQHTYTEVSVCVFTLSHLRML